MGGSVFSIADEELFTKIHEYQWNSDKEFQTGLESILAQSDEEHKERTTIRAKCFFYARKYGVGVNFPSYELWLHGTDKTSLLAIHKKDRPSRNIPSALAADDDNSEKASLALRPPYPKSFTSIVNMITKNQAVPDIREVPDTLLEGQASDRTKKVRAKPWEKADIRQDGHVS